MTRLLLCSFNARFTHTNLAIRYLAMKTRTLLSPAVSVSVREWTINDHLMVLLDQLNELDADLYAFSCYIWNSALTRTVVHELKKIRPQATVIFGGPEAATQADVWLKADPAIDFIISGEGETSFPALIAVLASKQPLEPDSLSAIPGLFWRDQGNIRFNHQAKPLSGDDWPFPYEDADLNANKNRMIYYETSRGCPYRCSYCLSSIDKKLRERCLDHVLKELSYLIQSDVRQVKLVDRTFNSRPERAREIFSFLIDRYQTKPYRTQFHFEMAGDLLDDQTIDLLQDAPSGLFRFEIGVQSIHEHVLHAVHRSCDLKRMKAQIQRLRQSDRVELHLDLIAGLPGESLLLFAESFNWVYALKPDMFQLGFLKILSGTAMIETARESRYQWLSEAPYEVLQSNAMTFKELCFLKRIECLLDLFLHSKTCRQSSDWLSSFWETPFDFYSVLCDWFEKNNLFDRSLGTEERSRLLFQFAKMNRKHIGSQPVRLFLDLLRTEYQMGGEKGQPEWMNFFEHQRDSSSQRLLRFLRLRQESADQLQTTGQKRFDRIGFDWLLYQNTGRLEPGDWILVYQRTAQGLRQIASRPVNPKWI